MFSCGARVRQSLIGNQGGKTNQMTRPPRVTPREAATPERGQRSRELPVRRQGRAQGRRQRALPGRPRGVGGHLDDIAARRSAPEVKVPVCAPLQGAVQAGPGSPHRARWASVTSAVGKRAGLARARRDHNLETPPLRRRGIAPCIATLGEPWPSARGAAWPSPPRKTPHPAATNLCGLWTGLERLLTDGGRDGAERTHGVHGRANASLLSTWRMGRRRPCRGRQRSCKGGLQGLAA